jgi:hypothetical protein
VFKRVRVAHRGHPLPPSSPSSCALLAPACLPACLPPLAHRVEELAEGVDLALDRGRRGRASGRAGLIETKEAGRRGELAECLGLRRRVMLLRLHGWAVAAAVVVVVVGGSAHHHHHVPAALWLHRRRGARAGGGAFVASAAVHSCWCG